ncbi:MAG: hypothetical protein D6719_14045 [Candidatus Dadabacteria bacterium]|nr:MAG: hypothetical protein D6719_14045 [Candidatus Dadabacteria bacterium]
MLFMQAAMFPRVFFNGDVLSAGGLAFSYHPWRSLYDGAPEGVEINNILSDQFDSITPQLIYFRKCLLSGKLPLYTDLIQNGTPFLLVIRHNLLAVPLLLCILVLGVAHGVTVFILLAMFCGGLCCYYYLRNLSLKPAAAFLGLTVFSFNTYAAQVLGFQMYLQYALLPVSLLAIEKILAGGRHGIAWRLLFTLTLPLYIVAGYPFVAAFCAYFLGLYLVFRIISLKERKYNLFRDFIIMGLAALLLVSPTIFGSIDFFSGYDWSHRARNWAVRFNTKNLVTYILPYFYGDIHSPVVPFNWHQDCIYLGVIALPLLLLTLTRNLTLSIRFFYFLFALWLIAICYDLGGILELFYRHIPVLRNAYPIHQRHLLVFIGAVLVAFGFNDLLELPFSARRLLLGALLIALISCLVVYSTIQFYATLPLPEQFRAHLSILLPIAALSIILLLILPACGKYKNILAGFIILLSFADLLAVTRGYNPVMPARYFYPKTAGIEFLKKHTGNYKVLLLGTTFLANTPMAFGIRTVAGRGFFNSRLQNLYRLINEKAFLKHKTQFVFPLTRETRLSSEVVDALGIKYVVAPPGLKPSALPYGDTARKNIVVLQQKEWNSSVRLTKSSIIEQTFVARARLKASSLALYLKENLLERRAYLFAEIHSGKKKRRAFIKVKPRFATRVVLNFRDLLLTPGEPVLLKIYLGRKAKGSISIYSAEKVDILKSGQAYLNGKPLDADLKFELLHPNANYASAREEQKHNHLNDYSLVYDDDIAIWENKDVFPRAWLVGRIKVSNDNDTLMALHQEKANLRQVAWISQDDFKTLKDFAGRSSKISYDIKTLSFNETQQVFRVKTDLPALLVVADNFDTGWKVKVNGSAKKLLRVNYNMRAVPVPAGESLVQFAYRPAYLFPSIAASLFGLLLTAFAVFRSGGSSVKYSNKASRVRA